MKLHRLLLLLLPVVLAGCTKNEITLSFSLPAGYNNPCRILYYASDKAGGMIRETAVEISDGKGEITLPSVNPTVIYLFSSSQRMPDLAIFAERGEKVEISGSSANMKEWSVGGNKVNEEVSRWRAANVGVLAGDDAENLNSAVSKFVKSHPESDAAAFILFFYYSRRENPTGFDSLYKLIAKKNHRYQGIMAALGAADMLADEAIRKIPGEIVLMGEDGWRDTVVFSSRRATLLFFRETARDAGIVEPDSVKKIAKDALEGSLVEIYAGNDSLGWKRHLREDTIPELKRLWMPLGSADTTAISLGVRRFPYYMVIDKNSKIIYEGLDWQKAADKVRKKKQ